jgi:hypothetical protein
MKFRDSPDDRRGCLISHIIGGYLVEFFCNLLALATLRMKDTVA